jgi:hypothetical protein
MGVLMRVRVWFFVAVACGSVASVGCPGTLDDPGRFSACPDVPSVVFVNDCLGSGCHGTVNQGGNLDLQSPNVGTRLLGKKATDAVSLLIDPDHPEKSVLYTKIHGPVPYGSRMPLSRPPLDDRTQACVLTWIESLSKPTDAGADALPDVVIPPQDASDSGLVGRDLTTDTSKFGLGGPSLCGGAKVQLCEDFESGQLDTNTWKVTGTAPTIDGVQKARGQKALHIKQSGSGASYIRETKTFPATNNTYFGRAYVYFATLAGPPMSYAHWTFIAASGTQVSGEIRVSGQFQNGNNLFGVGTDNRVDDAGTGDWTTSDTDPNKTPKAVPTNQWLCIEWMHKGDTNETRFYWDAVEHPSLYTTSSKNGGNGNPYILPNFTNVWLGWQEYQTSTINFEMWLDEIAIDPSRIGCVL